MRPIILPRNHIYKDQDFYYSFLEDNKFLSSFKIDNRNYKDIILIIQSNNNPHDSKYVIHNFLYFLYCFVKIDDITNPLPKESGGMPKDGSH